ncbi:MAG TPA: FKBP-type peptidyl-prolyl cis-trans isomerase [Bacteroidales bacterium]|nr:FKBP-type peptidyl-prolyl cis-trans isomerase [Bacteroidales bacterium]
MNIKLLLNKIIALPVLFAGLVILLFSCNNDSIPEDQKLLPYSVVKKIHREELLNWNKNLVEIDYTVIQKYIERRKWKMEVSESGLYYQIYYKTDNEEAADGLVAVFSYSTSLLDGTVLYTSEEFGNRELHLGHNQDESGLNEGLMLMKKGEKARFILPPHLAFGVPGDGYRVPYYSILVYEIELLDLYAPERVSDELIEGWN